MKDDKENFSQLRRKDVDLMSKNIDLNHRLNVLNDEVDACKTHVERSANHSSTNLNFLLNSVRSNGLAERTPNKSMTLVSIPAKRKSPVNFALTPPRMYQIQDTRKNNARLNESCKFILACEHPNFDAQFLFENIFFSLLHFLHNKRS